MKFFIIILSTIFFLSSCGSNAQNEAVVTTNEIPATIQPGGVATSVNGYMMKAIIDGKEWVATSMISPDAAGRIIGYYNKEYIGLPYSKADMVAGKKMIIGEDNAADLFMNDGCSYPLTHGEIEITKVDENFAEGKFFFTTFCSSKNKTAEVKDGFFRISFNKE